ncbi:MAG: hypothetical protein F4238_01720 [Gemmatimonadetes bacterium]|nr:hypothetical protein [Gemmatimonadota bacterium]
MKKLVIMAALAAASMSALADERYTRINFDFGKEGVFYQNTETAKYCQEDHCQMKMSSAKLVLDYGISDATDVGIIPAAAVISMTDGLRYPAIGACVSNSSVITCTLSQPTTSMELTWNAKKTTGTGYIWHGSVDYFDKFAFTWSVPKKPKKKADTKSTQPPPTNNPPGT